MNLPLMVTNFHGRHRVICAFREVARSIAKKNNLCVDVDNILFVIDETTNKAARTASDIFRVPAVWRDVLYQLTLRRFDFVMKFYDVNLEAIAGNPKVFIALVYHELKHIKQNSKTGELYLDTAHEIEDWEELVPFGDWEHDMEEAQNLPDFMSGGFE